MNIKKIIIGIVIIIIAVVILIMLGTESPSSNRLILGTPTQEANSYYVSASGNDANNGTLESPFKSITKAMSEAQAGYSIYVRSGTYPSFTVGKNNITISNYVGESPILSGGNGVVINGSNVTISGFEVTNMSASLSAGITSFGADNIVKNNVVHDNIYVNSSGIIIAGSNNQVLDNVVYNNNKFGIGIYGATAINNTISRNTTYNHTLSAGDSDGIHCSGDSKNNTFSENITYGNSDDGLDTWDCTNNLITKNISHHNGGTGDGNGFKLGLGGDNTATDNTSYSNFTCGFTSNGSGNYYENNTSYSNGECGFEDSYRIMGNTQTSSFINNLAYNNPTNFIRGQYTTVFTGNSEIEPIGTVSITPTKTPASVVTTSSSNTYYVSTSGNDSNNGSQSLPFRTIAKAMSVMQSGNSVRVVDGNYSLVTVTKTGLTLVADNATVQGFLITGNNTTISGFLVNDASSYGIELLSSNSVIKDNTITRGRNSGLFVGGNNNLIENNDISKVIQPKPHSSGGDANCVTYFGGGHVFRGNVCHDIYRDGNLVTDAHIDAFQSWDWTSKGGVGHDILFENNILLYPNGGTAKGWILEGNNSKNITIKNNLVVSRVIVSFVGGSNITFLNNTFVGVGNDSDGLHLNSTDVIITGNIFAHQKQRMIEYIAGDEIVTGSNNCYADYGFGVPSFSGDIKTTNAGFVNESIGDYHLQSNSPCVGKGAYVGDTSAVTPTQIPTFTPTLTRTFTVTPPKTHTPTQTASQTETNTVTPSFTPTTTFTPTLIPTATFTLTPTPTPVTTVVPTQTVFWVKIKDRGVGKVLNAKTLPDIFSSLCCKYEPNADVQILEVFYVTEIIYDPRLDTDVGWDNVYGKIAEKNYIPMFYMGKYYVDNWIKQ